VQERGDPVRRTHRLRPGAMGKSASGACTSRIEARPEANEPSDGRLMRRAAGGSKA